MPPLDEAFLATLGRALRDGEEVPAHPDGPDAEVDLCCTHADGIYDRIVYPLKVRYVVMEMLMMITPFLYVTAATSPVIRSVMASLRFQSKNGRFGVGGHTASL